MQFPDTAGRRTPPWLIGMGSLTFGLAAGFAVTALPFLLAKAGIGVGRIAGISAVALSPTFWAFLVTPIVDVGFTRRTYAFVLACGAALSLTAALWLFSPERLPLFTALLLLAELGVVLQASAVGGWVSEFVANEQRGKVGGWTNVANLGGGALGAMAMMGLASWCSFRALGLIIGFGILASSLVLLGFPAPVLPVLGLGRVFGGTFRSVVKTSRQPEVLTGFLIFLAPAACVAAINLFAALGADFRAAPRQVVWVTGAGAAITCSLGALLGGYMADRVDRGVLYMTGGILGGAVALALAFSPHRASVFIAGVLIYNGVAGLCYAAFSALGLQLVGTRNPTAATQLALFAAASNSAVVYMTWADGQGYGMFGIRGLFLTDGVAAIGAAIPLLIFLRWRARLRPNVTVQESLADAEA
ncbi:MAG: hypothetical protein ABI165_20665 [Bryobacteraceae bacterium]